MKIEVIKPKFYLVYYNKMLSIIVMADDDFELKKGLEALFMLDHIAKHIIIVDLWLKNPQLWYDSALVINAKSYGKGRVYGLNQAMRRVENETVLVMDCRCRIAEQELREMLIEADYNEMVSPSKVNDRINYWVCSDFFIFRQEKSVFPIDKRLIDFHYEKWLEGKIKVFTCWTIKKVEWAEKERKIKNRDDYRYQKDLSTMRQIEKEWQS